MIPSLILDTSVLIAGLRSSLGASFVLLDWVGKDRFTLGLTAPLVLEYEATCMKSLSALNLTADDIRELLDYFCRVGNRSTIRFRVRPSVADPDDELVVEAAVASGSEWIVTHNIRDMAAGAAVWYRGHHAGRSTPAAKGRAMNSILVELPAELRAEVARRAGQEFGGESAWVADAVREKLVACAEREYLEARAARGSREAFERVLGKVPAAPPLPGDEGD